MSYILDTHTLLWFEENDPKLSRNAKYLIETTNEPLFVSIVSLWEIAIKINIGKLKISIGMDTLLAYLTQQEISILAISNLSLSQYISLPLYHKDPFDRMIIAQAQVDGLAIIGTDDSFDEYHINRVW